MISDATQAMEYLQRLMSKGYVIRMQKVNGDIFIFANHFGITGLPELAAKQNDIIKCARVMEIDEAQGKEPS